jgi:hypothetical protein
MKLFCLKKSLSGMKQIFGDITKKDEGVPDASVIPGKGTEKCPQLSLKAQKSPHNEVAVFALG